MIIKTHKTMKDEKKMIEKKWRSFYNYIGVYDEKWSYRHK